MISAAYKSPTAAEVFEFQIIRESWLGSSRMGYDLFDALSIEYARFARPAATAMDLSEPLRESIRTLLVEPLLNCYRLIDMFVKSSLPEQDLDEKFRERLSEHRLRLLESGLGDADVEYAAQFFGALTRELLKNENTELDPAALALPAAGATVAVRLISSLTYLSRLMKLHRFPTHLIWGVATPLGAYWDLIAIYGVAHKFAVEQGPCEHLKGALQEWISRMPIPPRYKQLNRDQATRELTQLSSTFFTKTILKAALRQRVAVLFRNDVNYDLQEMFDQLDQLEA